MRHLCFCNQRLKIGFNWLDLYLWRHSFVVIVFVSISRQIGQVSSLCKLRAETAISVSSVMASWGVRCSSYSERSQDLSIGSVLVMIDALIWNALSDVYSKGSIWIFDFFTSVNFRIFLFFQFCYCYWRSSQALTNGMQKAQKVLKTAKHFYCSNDC